MTKETKRVLFQIFLFVATLITTTFAGTEWVYGKYIYTITKEGNLGFNPDYSWSDFALGLEFSIPLILILTVHEFGHYFVALYHRVKASLPYYIPIPPLPILPFSIGTMGAVIRLRSRPVSNVQNFDIGLAGPLAGFVVALAFMFYGFKTLPPAEHIFKFHPEYEQFGKNYADHVYSEEYLKGKENVVGVLIGKNLLFLIFEQFVEDKSRIPNEHELMHYPILLAAYIALFITCLNLLPIGQLDGGHVVYGLFGYRKHKIIATVSFIALLFYAGLGLPYINPKLPAAELVWGVLFYLMFLYVALSGLARPRRDVVMYALLIFTVQFLLANFFPGVEGYQGWLLFGLVLGRFIGVAHPPSDIEQPLDNKRIVLGWVTLLVFILCFSPAPLQLEVFFSE